MLEISWKRPPIPVSRTASHVFFTILILVLSGELFTEKCTRFRIKGFQALRYINTGALVLVDWNLNLTAQKICSCPQNEPETMNPTLPSCMYTTKAQEAVAVSLRKLLDSNGMNDVKIIGYDHNWDDAAKYVTQLVSVILFATNSSCLKVSHR